MDNTDLITKARELCGAATPGPWNNFGDWMIHTEPDVEHNGIPNKKTIGTVRKNNAAFIAASRTLVPQLCDALEAAEKENEGLKNILQFNMVQIHGERMTVLDALSSLTARAEKAEAENRWIPVGERLPEDSEPVYAYCPTGRGSVEATMGMMVRAHKYSGYTHWMPRAVPEPPKGE